MKFTVSSVEDIRKITEVQLNEPIECESTTNPSLQSVCYGHIARLYRALIPQGLKTFEVIINSVKSQIYPIPAGTFDVKMQRANGIILIKCNDGTKLDAVGLVKEITNAVTFVTKDSGALCNGIIGFYSSVSGVATKIEGGKIYGLLHDGLQKVIIIEK